MEGERVAARPVLAMKRGNTCGAKGPYCTCSLDQHCEAGTNDKSVRQSARSEIRTIRQEEG